MLQYLYKRNQKGFSLLEVIISVSVIAILGAVAIPVYEKRLAKSRRGECTEMLSTLYMLQDLYRSADHLNNYENKFTNNAIYCPKDKSGLHTYTVAGGEAVNGINTKNALTLPLSVSEKYCNSQPTGSTAFPNVLTSVVAPATTYKVAYQYRYRAANSTLLSTLVNSQVSDDISTNISPGNVIPSFSSGSRNVHGYLNPSNPSGWISTASVSSLGLEYPTSKYHFMIECRGNIDEGTSYIDILYMDHNGKTGIYQDDVKN